MCGFFNDGVGFLVNNVFEGIDFQHNLVCCPGICVEGHIPRYSSLGIVGVSDATGRGALRIQFT